MQIPTIKTAIIGCGVQTEQAFLPTLSKMGGFKVESLIDIDLNRSRTLAERYNIGHYARTIDEIPATVEAAIVAVPNYLHGPVVCALMNKKLHVFCEKPMATTSSEGEAMMRCAEENKVTLAIGNVYRYYWTSRRIKQIIESRELGDLISFHIEAGKSFDWPASSDAYYRKEKAGGGVLIDTGAHVLDLLLWWLQDYPTDIKYRDDNYGGVEAECYVELGFASTVSGSVRLSRLKKLQNQYRLRFTGGEAIFQPYDPSGVCHTISLSRDGTKTLLKAKRANGYLDYVEQELADFLEGIKTGCFTGCSAASVLPSIRLIDECYGKATRQNAPWLVNKETTNIITDETGEGIDIRKSKILITGAGGFIGGRIAERLFLEHDNVPRCFVRNFNKLARLYRFPAEIIMGDVLDYDAVVKATDGCNVVIHAAYGNTRDEDLDAKINTVGTENVIRACVENGIRKLIFLSSVEVYGSSQPPVVDEETETTSSGNGYATSKLDAEQLCAKWFKERSLPVVTLRLGVVYGPHAPIWTVDVINRLASGGFCLSEEFEGMCNVIYIDDCVDAIVLAVCRGGNVGETFVISGGEKITWNQYFSAYNDMLGLPPLRRASKAELRLYKVVRRGFDTGLKYFQPRYGGDMFSTYSRLRERRQIPNMKGFLQRGSLLDALEVFGRPAYYSIEKAKRRLGFVPKYSFERGMTLVRQWAFEGSEG